MKKILVNIFLITAFVSCSDSFLEKEPFGELTAEQAQAAENIEGVIISAYSVLNGQIDEASNAFNSPASNWSFGDVTSDDAYKGGGGAGDQNHVHQMEIFQTHASLNDIERKWRALYEGVKRANDALRILNASEDIEAGLKAQRIAEMKFLRGHFYFELKKIYNQIGYIDETAVKIEDFEVSNTEFSSEQLWAKIEDDFKAAYGVLPASQTAEPGRPTKWAAQAYLAKTYIFQQKWTEALAAANDVINNGGFSLMTNFNEVFLPENDNGPEIIFAIQNSINDGSPRNYNGSIGDRLMPPGGPYPKYGFLRPTQNMVNAFKTDAAGFPVTNFNAADLTAADNVDPRLDHTIGRPGIPYLDLGILYEASWAREAATYGPYGPKKRMLSKNSPHYLPNWPYVVALNYYIIRYADVLLWKAEAAIETGDLAGGMAAINEVRERAANSTVKELDGVTDAASYKVSEYIAFANKAEAIEALKFERRLEMAHEGHRFFDLVRWGIAADIMNTYFAEEKSKRSYLTNVTFTANKNEYMPIPQLQIDLGKGLITQNPGY